MKMFMNSLFVLSVLIVVAIYVLNSLELVLATTEDFLLLQLFLLMSFVGINKCK